MKTTKNCGKVGELAKILKRMEKFACPNIQGCNCLIVENNTKLLREKLVKVAEDLYKDCILSKATSYFVPSCEECPWENCAIKKCFGGLYRKEETGR